MNASLQLENDVLPMKLGAEYDIAIYHKTVFTGPLADILTGALITLNDTMLPPDITHLKDYLFRGNVLLMDVNLTHIETTGAFVFMECALENVNMPALRICGSRTFSYNPLTNICLPNLIEISSQLFQDCENLSIADFERVMTIYGRAFYNCQSLETLILRSNFVVELNGQSIFHNTKIESGEGYIYVPEELVSSYQTAEGWSDYASQIRSIEELNE